MADNPTGLDLAELKRRRDEKVQFEHAMIPKVERSLHLLQAPITVAELDALIALAEEVERLRGSPGDRALYGDDPYYSARSWHGSAMEFLAQRDALVAALEMIAREIPRGGWKDNPEGLVKFARAALNSLSVKK